MTDYSNQTKDCASCGEQPVSAFGKNSRQPDGLMPQCKMCRNAKLRADYAAAPDRQKVAMRRYYERNRETIAARREERKPEMQAKARESYAARMASPENRDAHNDYHRRYRAEHRDRIRQIQAEHYERTKVVNPDQIERKRRNRRERERQAGWVTPKLKKAVFAHYGPSCYLCHGTATETDHYQPIAAGGVTELENLRPVCKGCNSRKGVLWPFDEAELRARILAEYAADRPSEVA